MQTSAATAFFLLSWTRIQRFVVLACTILTLCVPVQAWAVYGPLEDAHKPLVRILKDVIRYDIRHDRNMAYTRTMVRYGAIKTSARWKEYRKALLCYDHSKIKAASVDDKKAFWINCYNVFVMEGVAELYPLASAGGFAQGSVKSLPEFFQQPHPIAGIEVSLSDIERRLSASRDPRIWFAINQGAVSSPAHPAAPYTSGGLNDQLDSAVSNYLSDPLNFRVDREKNTVVLSQVFTEHAAEFSSYSGALPAPLQTYTAEERGILGFIFPRIRHDDRQYIIEHKPAISFEAFDWNLNAA